MKNIRIMGTVRAFIVVRAFPADIMLVPAIMKINNHEKAIKEKEVDIQMPNSLKKEMFFFKIGLNEYHV